MTILNLFPSSNFLPGAMETLFSKYIPSMGDDKCGEASRATTNRVHDSSETVETKASENEFGNEIDRAVGFVLASESTLLFPELCE
jgi:hypothetical protein